MRLLGGVSASEAAVRQAAWSPAASARGRGSTHSRRHRRADHEAAGAPPWPWRIGLRRVAWRPARSDGTRVGSGRWRAVVHILGPGHVDDVQLLDIPFPDTAHALADATLWLDPEDFERLLATSLPIGRSWLSSVAQRLATSQKRHIGPLGRTLTQRRGVTTRRCGRPGVGQQAATRATPMQARPRLPPMSLLRWAPYVRPSVQTRDGG